MKLFLSTLLGFIFPMSAFCYVGETFTFTTANNVDMTFTITSESGTPTVMTGNTYSHCIDQDYDGEVVVPSVVYYNNQQYMVTEISRLSFDMCNITSLSLPSTLQVIQSCSIQLCFNLHSLTIPASVTLIEEGGLGDAFLSSLVVESGNSNYVTVNNVLYNKSMTTLLQYATESSAQHFTVPNTVTRIGNWAFCKCDNLVEVTIPESVKEIGEWALYSCRKLGKVRIPASVINIGKGAFSGWNYAMKNIEIEANNPVYTSVDGVLYTKDLSTIVCYPVANERSHYDILDGTNTVYGGAFSCSRNLYSIQIPNTVTTIGENAFSACDKLNTTFPISSTIHFSL